MDIERVIVRVAQLLRLARDQPNKPEGALAGQIARQLQEKYNVDVQLTDAVSEKTTEFFRTPKNTKTTMSSTFLHMLACSAFEIEAEQHEDGVAAWLLTASDPLVPMAQRLGKRLEVVLMREAKHALKGFDDPDQAWVLGTAAANVYAYVAQRLEDVFEQTRENDIEEDEETTALVRYKARVNVPHHEESMSSAKPDRELTALPRRAGEKLASELASTIWYEVRQARRTAGF